MLDVSIPDDLWDGDAEGVLSDWFYASGALVRAGDVVGEVMVDKAQREIVAPAAGRLTVSAEVGQVVRRGDIIARIESVS